VVWRHQRQATIVEESTDPGQQRRHRGLQEGDPQGQEDQAARTETKVCDSDADADQSTDAEIEPRGEVTLPKKAAGQRIGQLFGVGAKKARNCNVWITITGVSAAEWKKLLKLLEMAEDNKVNGKGLHDPGRSEAGQVQATSVEEGDPRHAPQVLLHQALVPVRVGAGADALDGLDHRTR
jgi:hypothetical protein